MASTYTLPTGSFGDDPMQDPRNFSPPANRRHVQPSVIDSSHLSPNQAFNNLSNSGSPSFNNTGTPAESISTLSQYQSSDFSEHDDDPFFGADFGAHEGGTPSFLGDFGDLTQADHLAQASALPIYGDGAGNVAIYNAPDNTAYHPLTPEQTVSLHTTSPRSERKGANIRLVDRFPDSVSPQELQKEFKPDPIAVYPVLVPTPKSGSCQSSEDGLAPAQVVMPSHSPRVTVSLWGKDEGAVAETADRSFMPVAESPSTVRGGQNGFPARQDDMASWQRDPSASRRGIEPQNRPTTEVETVNDMMTRREIEERNQEVDKWLTENMGTDAPPEPRVDIKAIDAPNNNAPDDGIKLGDTTENKWVEGQTYYTTKGGDVTEEDVFLMRTTRTWADAPIVHGITKSGTDRYQPESSQAAITRFHRQCLDNESIVSKAATWGTRRRSLPSILDVDLDNLSGNFLKKLSISSRNDTRKNSLLGGLGRLVRRPSTGLKRTFSGHNEETFKSEEKPPHLAPPPRTSSWGTKKPVPSINTALVSMGHGAAAIGAGGAGGHSRSGSISATQVTSPKSPFGGLTVRNTVKRGAGRPRAHSDLPNKPPSKIGLGTESTHPNLVDLWKKSGGPPVASLKPQITDLDDDDDDDEDFEGDSELRAESSKMIDDITPTFTGFQSHILRLNPSLANTNNYLVDRIAHQQIVRYKSLLSSKVKHLQYGQSCPCGSLCVALGGVATLLDQKGDPRGLDPLSSRFDSSDGDITPIEGAITPESFPQDIPMPPTQTLPAEFECQLCYQQKKFQKPSDWTKHVHEDVQPFTCTWDKCRDPKIFKRKADWVRHENEGHRHLEWWTCDVDECRHTCYRRDNFLQHLVREHKFPEPKVKTKAALKRAGGNDPTWQKVEKCHVETNKRPQEEPCRFCGKQFPSWKKLTVHLAKHMEQISLPVLRLVAAKDLTADTIISPVQDPPPRPFVPLPVKRDVSVPYPTTAFNAGAGHAAMMASAASVPYQADQQSAFYPVNSVMSANPFQQQYIGTTFDGMGQGLDAALDMTSVNGVGQVNQAFGQTQPVQNLQQVQNLRQVQGMPVSSAQFVGAPYSISMAPNMEGFPAMNGLGLQNRAATMGGQLGYDSLMDATAESYTPQGSVSPYAGHSPHQGPTNFYHQ